MAIITRRYIRNQLDEGTIQISVSPTAAVLAVSPSHADIQVDDAVAGMAEGLDEYMKQLGFRFMEEGPATPLVAFYGSSKLIDNTKAIVSTPAFEIAGGVITNPGFFSPNLPATFGRITGAYRVTGVGAQCKIVEANPDGSNPEDKNAAPVDLANTLGVWKILRFQTDIAPRPVVSVAKPWQYTLEAQTGGTADFEFKYVSLSLMQLAQP